jgi:hypothetical protein
VKSIQPMQEGCSILDRFIKPGANDIQVNFLKIISQPWMVTRMELRTMLNYRVPRDDLEAR